MQEERVFRDGRMRDCSKTTPGVEGVRVFQSVKNWQRTFGAGTCTQATAIKDSLRDQLAAAA